MGDNWTNEPFTIEIPINPNVLKWEFDQKHPLKENLFLAIDDIDKGNSNNDFALIITIPTGTVNFNASTLHLDFKLSYSNVISRIIKIDNSPFNVYIKSIEDIVLKEQSSDINGLPFSVFNNILSFVWYQDNVKKPTTLRTFNLKLGILEFEFEKTTPRALK